MTDLGPLRPDKITIWPVEAGTFGLDVRWGGAAGNTRATQVRDSLAAAGMDVRLQQEVDGPGWLVRMGPLSGTEVGRVLENFLV